MRAMNPIARAAQALAAKTPGVQIKSDTAAMPKLGYQAAATNKSAIGDAVDQMAAQLKTRLFRKILWGSAASLIPLPLVDLAVDVALLSNILTDIHQTFGLTPKQLEALDPGKRHRTFAAIQWVGNRAIGQVITGTIVKRLISGMGLKLTAGQITKIVPVAGQIASAALNYGTLRHIINVHIDDCVAVVKQSNI
jgi:hypothetical protein